MLHTLHLEKFEGPFDLLLFLIHKHEVDIYDIPIAEITSQFINYVDRSEQINIVYAGEFIDMVATLMKIKAAMLLPSAHNEDEEIQDPRTELVQRLIEYKRFKEAARDLEDLEKNHEWIKSRSYFKYLKQFHHELIEEDSNPLSDLTLYDLIKAFRRVIDSMPKITEHEVRKITVTIEEQSNRIRNYLAKEKVLYFSKLMKEAEEKIYVVVSFVSILELTKAREIDLVQDELFEDICIKRHFEEPEAA